MREGGVKAHSKAGNNDNWNVLIFSRIKSILLFKNLVIEVPGQADWGSLKVLVSRPRQHHRGHNKKLKGSSHRRLHLSHFD